VAKESRICCFSSSVVGGFDQQLPLRPKPTKVKHTEYRHLVEATLLVFDVHSTDEENGRDCKVSA